ncbi:MAG: SprT-like domain-containing protein [Halarchaeum sp.]
MEFASDAMLRGWMRHETRVLVAADGLAVDTALVDVAVSARAKRRAGACRYTPLPDARVGDPIARGERPDATVELARRAADAFDEATLRDVLRHELVHVEQVQAYGVTDHGAAFRERADELDVPLSCPTFTDPAYVLRCTACEGVVGYRYRRCPTVETPERYRSDCCGAALAVESE